MHYQRQASTERLQSLSRRLMLKKRSKDDLQRCTSSDDITRSAGVVFGVRDSRNATFENFNRVKRSSGYLDCLKIPQRQRRSNGKIQRVQSERKIELDGESDEGKEEESARLFSKVPKTIGSADIIHPNNCPDNTDPDDYIKLLAKAQMGFLPQPRSSLTIPADVFPPPTASNLESYTMELAEAVRDENLVVLRDFHGRGKSLSGCNRFGESFIHTACRRGFTEVVQFLVEDANVSIRVRDDYGRTPVHDACWNRTPAFGIMDMLLRKDSFLLFLTDKRGFSPFQYARREHWKEWRQFLYERKDFFVWDEKIARLLGYNDCV